jgi:octopine/nopaline transport system substrate-binding protein
MLSMSGKKSRATGFLHFLAMLGVALGLASTPARAQQTIKIATEGTYPPWTFSNPQGGVQGFEVDLANDVCQRLSLKCEFVVQAFQEFIPGLNAGKFDVVLSALSITEERKKIVDFTRPYARISNGFAVAKKSTLASLPGTGMRYSLDEQSEAAQKAIDALKPYLKDKVLGTQAGSISAKFVDKYLRDAVGKVNEYKSTQDQDIDLSSGRTDIVMGSVVALTKSLSTPALQDFTLVGPSFVGGVFGLGYGAAFRKSDTDLRDKFDGALADAIKDGTIKKLSAKWLGIDVTP